MIFRLLVDITQHFRLFTDKILFLFKFELQFLDWLTFRILFDCDRVLFTCFIDFIVLDFRLFTETLLLLFDNLQVLDWPSFLILLDCDLALFTCFLDDLARDF